MPEYCDGCRSWFLDAWAYDTHHCETSPAAAEAERVREDAKEGSQ